mmetsp:Transcript_96726/g.134239  ORF Transcript_96726/g.134239 Transcript_96726/m.134239 type:complete len:149 (-) Transcript_96726:65-511(-)
MTTTKSVFTLKDVPADRFVAFFARHLKKSGKVELPDWIDLVKTGVQKELGPYSQDWYYIRAASIIRRLYVRPGAGVGAFRKIYGGKNRKNRGAGRNHFQVSSGAVIRHALQQLETLGLVEKDPKGGRRITSQGQRDCDRVAQQVVRRR